MRADSDASTPSIGARTRVGTRARSSDRRSARTSASERYRTAVTLSLVMIAIFGSGILGIFGSDVFAHRRDEYLQAARIALEPGRVELQLDLTAGIAVAETIIADIDRNRDGALTPDEQQAYVAQVLSAVSIEIDGHPVQMRPMASTFPNLDAIRRGEGTIALKSDAALPPLSDGTHHLSYHNTHRRDLSVYLANALVPDSDRVAISDLQRDTDQRDLTIDYVLHDAHGTSLSRVALFGWILTAAVCVTIQLRSWRASRSSRSSQSDRTSRAS